MAEVGTGVWREWSRHDHGAAGRPGGDRHRGLAQHRPAVARRMAENGASAMLVDIDQAGVEDAAATLRDSGFDATAVAADVTDEAAMENAVNAVPEGVRQARHRRGKRRCPASRSDRRHHQGPVAAGDRCQPHRGIRVAAGVCEGDDRRGEGGRLIATSSLFGVRGGRENVAYAASNSAVVGAGRICGCRPGNPTRSLSRRLPGQIRTPMG